MFFRQARSRLTCNSLKGALRAPGGGDPAAGAIGITVGCICYLQARHILAGLTRDVLGAHARNYQAPYRLTAVGE